METLCTKGPGCASAMVPAFRRFAPSCLFFAKKMKIPQRKQYTMSDSSVSIAGPQKQNIILKGEELFWNIQLKKVRASRSSGSRFVLFKQSFLN